jgi:hypothetical protein
MPIKDAETRREYHREYMRRKRAGIVPEPKPERPPSRRTLARRRREARELEEAERKAQHEQWLRQCSFCREPDSVDRMRYGSPGQWICEACVRHAIESLDAKRAGENARLAP